MTLLDQAPRGNPEDAFNDSYNSPAASHKAGYIEPTPNQPGYIPNHYDAPPPHASYVQNPYAENVHIPPTDNQGYAYREGVAPAASTPTIKPGKFAFMGSKWPAAFMVTSGVQALLGLAFESYVFGKFQSNLGHYNHDDGVQSQYKTIPTFLTLFIFGFLYDCIVVWDALHLKNTIQIIGVCIANLALLVYAAIQVDQVRMAIDVLGSKNALSPDLSADELYDDVQAYLVALPIIIAAATVVMSFISWKLYQEFAWDILKQIGADYRMKRRFLYYQIYLALLKFDFFFFLGFIIQFVVVVAKRDDPEFALTIATIPVTVIILLAAAYFTRHENKTGMVIIIILYFGGLSYFIFKLVRIYEPGFSEYYIAVKRTLTAFAVITILLIIMTIINAIICMRNFGNGLKDHLLAKPSKTEAKPDLNSVHLPDVKPQLPSRMTIE